MDLVHYNHAPITLDRGRSYGQQDDGGWTYEKPKGFWVSVSGDDDWPSWCRGEEFRLAGLDYAHRVRLADNHNVLRLSTVDDLFGFTGRYRRGGLIDADRGGMGGIDWARVTREFDGIIIAPYQWSCRYALAWYYGWDCASGCIWDLDVIAAVEPAVQVVNG